MPNSKDRKEGSRKRAQRYRGEVNKPRKKVKIQGTQTVPTNLPVQFLNIDLPDSKGLFTELQNMFTKLNEDGHQRPRGPFNHLIPRDQISLSVDGKLRYIYNKSAREMPLRPWGSEVNKIIDLLQEKLRVTYELVLVNQYKDGDDSVSWHSDDEAMIDQAFPIISISVGHSRIFKVRQKLTSYEKEHNKQVNLERKQPKKMLTLPGDEEQKEQLIKYPIHNFIVSDGDVLIMGAGCQTSHEHMVPKMRKGETIIKISRKDYVNNHGEEKKIIGVRHGDTMIPRFNLTFRKYNSSNE